MPTEPSILLVIMKADPENREIISDVIGPSARVIYLEDIPDVE
ncbi:MAG: hypothetical protein ACR2OV_09235 [Hyphomicrobiaceae bacterium]